MIFYTVYDIILKKYRGLFMEVLGVLGGVAVLLALYVFTMLVYFAVKQKFVYKKYAVEISVIITALLVSAVMRFIIAYKSNEVEDALSRALYAVYSAIGGFSFEGVDISGLADLNVIYSVLYLGAVLYTGLIVLSVITVGVSYEINSYIKAVILKIKLKISSRTDVYLFTSATEDVLLLANDVQKRYDDGKIISDGKPRKCAIIFSGAELGAFDRKNEVHREIMSRGYIYWSYSKRKNSDREQSLLKRFGLRVNNYVGGKRTDTRIRVFALNLGESLTGLESENSDIVFDEIAAELREFVKKKGGALKTYAAGGTLDERLFNNTVVNFYILTDSDINFGFYRRTLDKMVDEAFISAVGETETVAFRAEEIKNKMKSELQLHILNEAILAADSLSRRRAAEYDKHDGNSCILWDQSHFLEDLKPDSENNYRVAVLGFGKTGQHAMNTLFVQTSYVNPENGEPSRFVAEVFDERMNAVSGTFAYNHPLYHCIEGDGCFTSTDEIEKAIKNDKLVETCKPLYGKFLTKCGVPERYCGDNEEEKTKNGVEKLMGFPVVVLHNASCFEGKFMQNLDSGIGGDKKKSKFAFKAFIISLGDDEKNINMANALIDDYKHEALSGEVRGGSTQTLYVNIRDEKNYGKLNWEKDDGEKLREACGAVFNVIPFGSREEMYGYDAVIEDYSCSLYHCAYSVVTGDLSEKYINLLENALKGTVAKDENLLPVLNEWKNGSTVLSEEKRRLLWLNVSPQYKLSNSSVCFFSTVYRTYMRGKKELFAEELAYLAAWEHMRWSRFHMAGGWIYADYENSEKVFRRRNKEHVCLCPFDMLDAFTKIYDVANVVISIKDW